MAEATRPPNLCTISTSLKSTAAGYLFAADSVGLSSFASTQRDPEKLNAEGCVLVLRTVVQAIQGQQNCYRSKAYMRLHISLSL